MKTDIHPEYVLATVRCSCGNEFDDAIDEARSPRRDLLRVPPLLHRASRSSWTRADGSSASSAGSSARSALDSVDMTVGGQAVLEGVMMRTPSNWAVAVRKPDGEIAQVCKVITSPMAKRRIYRLPVIRGIIALGESLAIGFRALAISANYAAQEEEGEEDIELSRGQMIFAFAIAIGFALALFKVGPALITSRLDIETTQLFVVVEGLIRVGIFIAYLVPDLASPRPQAAVPVPRGRAQGDQRL